MDNYLKCLHELVLGLIPDVNFNSVVEEVVVFEGRMVLFAFLLRRLAIDGGALEVVLLVDLQVVGENVAGHDQVALHVVHRQSVHSQVLREQSFT